MELVLLQGICGNVCRDEQMSNAKAPEANARMMKCEA